MNDTRVRGERGRAATVARPTVGGRHVSGKAGERVLGSHGFTTPRGDRGHVVLLAGGQGLVMMQRVELNDGSVLEWTRAVRSTNALVRSLRGVTLTGNANAAHARLLRLADEHFARMAGA